MHAAATCVWLVVLNHRTPYSGSSTHLRTIQNSCAGECPVTHIKHLPLHARCSSASRRAHSSPAHSAILAKTVGTSAASVHKPGRFHPSQHQQIHLQFTLQFKVRVAARRQAPEARQIDRGFRLQLVKQPCALCHPAMMATRLDWTHECCSCCCTQVK
jgi:hypothetical protein